MLRGLLLFNPCHLSGHGTREVSAAFSGSTGNSGSALYVTEHLGLLEAIDPIVTPERDPAGGRRDAWKAHG